jgi:hypothetical protein
MKSWAAPTPEEVARAVTLLARREQQRYFFDKLQNPAWIKPLGAKGFFAKPPDPERNEREGTIRFIPWPQSQYLARMAGERPGEVSAVLLSLPDTDNLSVHQDILIAAAAMPFQDAGELARREATWLEKQQWLHGVYAKHCSRLVVHLLGAKGEHQTAIWLARELLRLKGNPGPLVGSVKGKIDEYSYATVLGTLRAPLVSALHVEAIPFLAELLASALAAAHEKAPEDYSYVWRPAIEEHDQNDLQADRIPSVLVSTLRDAALQAIEENPERLDDMLRALLKYPWRAYRRLAYHLARVRQYRGPFLSTLLADRNALDDVASQREYSQLLATSFGLLLPADQQAILTWIRSGPAEIDRDREGWERRLDGWKSRRLHLVREQLIGDDKALYEGLVAKYGEPAVPDFPYKVGVGWVGPTSPVAKENLKEKNDQDLFAYLSSWAPEGPDTWGPAPSRRGLARELEALESEEPTRLWSLGERLRTLNPTYVSALLNGLAAAVAKEAKIAWEPPLDLAAWVCAQPHTEEEENSWEEGEKTWNNAKRAAVRLVTAGMRSKANIPIEPRDLVWKIVGAVTNDPDPTSDHEARFGGKNMGPGTLAINSNRGEAMNAAVAYGLWLRGHLDPKAAWQGFESAPELREALEAHLDPSLDPSLAIRSVYGQWFPWLHLMDPNWAVYNIAIIFPEEPENVTLWEVAWRSYVTHARPYDSMLSVLRRHYERAVQRIGQTAYETDYVGEPEEQLAEHIVVFFLRGLIEKDDELMASLFARASAQLRKHIINFIGRSLWEHEAPKPIRDRMHALWSYRLAASMPPADTTELKDFGAWFAAEHEDPAWALPELLKVLKVQPDIELEFMVLKRLAMLVSDMPALAAEALFLLVTRATELWTLTVDNESISKILKTALEAGDPAKRLAHSTIDHFGKSGIHTFRNLLQNSH